MVSFIIPVFNRPEEMAELLESLDHQSERDFEVIVVEDGSTRDSENICKKYEDHLRIQYFRKENSGPGSSRNFGAERANGEYLIILDSDVVLPENYLKSVITELNSEPADAFGGPDRAHPSFSDTQKAINYSMTSFFTTGGIRGGKKKLDKFYPRSFNMGIRKEVYKTLGGFSNMRFGEDIDFSIRIFKGGYRCRLFPDAWVWHKRRTDLKKFFRQVYNSGIARINLYKKYPDSLKVVHLMPAFFTTGVLALVSLSLIGLCMSLISGAVWTHWLAATPWMPIIAYCLILLTDSALRNKSLKVGVLSVCSSFIQLTGYGSGFIYAWWRRCVRKRDEFSAFNTTFYK